MSNNKKILALAIAGALGTLSNAAYAVVDLNAATGAPSFASEVPVPAGGLNLNNAGELDAEVAVGFGVSALQTRFIRFDFSPAKLNSKLENSDFTTNAAGALFTIVQGGSINDSYVIVQVTAGAAGIDPTHKFYFTVGGLTPANALLVSSQSAQSLKYALYEFAGNAVGQTSALAVTTGPWFNFASGLDIACTASGNTNKINSANAKKFVGPLSVDVDTSELFNLTMATAGGVVLPTTGSTPAGLSDFMGAGTTVKVTGGFTGLAGLVSGVLPGSTVLPGSNTFAIDASQSFGTWTYGTPTDFTDLAITAKASGTTSMAPSTYSVLITPTAGAQITTAMTPINLGQCGQLVYSGSSDRVDLVLTPGGGKQWFRITNPSQQNGTVTVIVYNDDGQKVTFPLSAISVAGTPISATLNSQASTQLIPLSDLYAAAQATDATFAVTGAAKKLRVEVRGTFGDDEVDGHTAIGGKPTVGRLKDGIYIQSVADAIPLYQSH